MAYFFPLYSCSVVLFSVVTFSREIGLYIHISRMHQIYLLNKHRPYYKVHAPLVVRCVYSTFQCHLRSGRKSYRASLFNGDHMPRSGYIRYALVLIYVWIISRRIRFKDIKNYLLKYSDTVNYLLRCSDTVNYLLRCSDTVNWKPVQYRLHTACVLAQSCFL